MRALALRRRSHLDVSPACDDLYFSWAVSRKNDRTNGQLLILPSLPDVEVYEGVSRPCSLLCAFAGAAPIYCTETRNVFFFPVSARLELLRRLSPAPAPSFLRAAQRRFDICEKSKLFDFPPPPPPKGKKCSIFFSLKDCPPIRGLQPPRLLPLLAKRIGKRKGETSVSVVAAVLPPPPPACPLLISSPSSDKDPPPHPPPPSSCRRGSLQGKESQVGRGKEKGLQRRGWERRTLSQMKPISPPFALLLLLLRSACHLQRGWRALSRGPRSRVGGLVGAHMPMYSRNSHLRCVRRTGRKPFFCCFWRADIQDALV